MTNLFEHAPIVLFFITYFLYGFFTATQIFVITTALLLCIQIYENPKQPLKNYLNNVLIILLGSLTLLTNNPIYLIWAPTIKYLLAATALIISRLFFNTSLLEKGFQLANLHAPTYSWYRLDYGLSLIFVLMAVINIQVFHSFGSEIWTKFKLYSLLGWVFLFIPIIMHIEAKSHEAQSE